MRGFLERFGDDLRFWLWTAAALSFAAGLGWAVLLVVEDNAGRPSGPSSGGVGVKGVR